MCQATLGILAGCGSPLFGVELDGGGTDLGVSLWSWIRSLGGGAWDTAE